MVAEQQLNHLVALERLPLEDGKFTKNSLQEATILRARYLCQKLHDNPTSISPAELLRIPAKMTGHSG